MRTKRKIVCWLFVSFVVAGLLVYGLVTGGLTKKEHEAKASYYTQRATECDERAVILEREIPFVEQQQREAIARGVPWESYGKMLMWRRVDTRAARRFADDFRKRAAYHLEQAAKQAHKEQENDG